MQVSDPNLKNFSGCYGNHDVSKWLMNTFQSNLIGIFLFQKSCIFVFEKIGSTDFLKNQPIDYQPIVQ